MNNREFNSVYISSPHYGVPSAKISQYMYICLIFVRYPSLTVCCMTFGLFLLVTKSPVFVSLPLQHDHSKRTEKWKLHFARKCLARKWHIKLGKMSRKLWLACFFKMQSPTACGTTTRKYWLLTDSLPPARHQHTSHKNHIILFTVFCLHRVNRVTLIIQDAEEYEREVTLIVQEMQKKKKGSLKLLYLLVLSRV